VKVASDIPLLINAWHGSVHRALAAKDVSKAPLEEVNYFGLLALSQALKNTPAFQSGGALLFYDLAIEKNFQNSHSWVMT
jgi:hypothetical protein